MPVKKSHNTSQPVPPVIQLAYNLVKNRPVGYNMAVHWTKRAIQELSLPLVVSPENIIKIVCYYDANSLQLIRR